MCVSIREKSPLKELVWGEAKTRYNVGRIESSLFHIGKVIFWITVQFQYADFDEWIFFMTPDFGYIEWILRFSLWKAVCSSVMIWK